MPSSNKKSDESYEKSEMETAFDSMQVLLENQLQGINSSLDELKTIKEEVGGQVELLNKRLNS